MKIHTKPCPECNEAIELRVTPQEHLNWLNGMLIQDAFPNMNKDDRERLISGYCAPCWDAVFGGLEEV